ncbi:TfdA family taurine catabolism dioxygenase TauD [Actinomadura pelletieri DSM 43383]|uniref:TfdA family taurine catabolism dioxygenase TauD n=1 Tax=Actinomadura pelletieri DSM 43383 TaxID=1120940 RepID=A0A495QAK1_9ACTN|nr:TauD/TfdA family dioxygenase [Actinomadura pelletieri]RKS68361.1 TfdA family taurine catabolism dioxygenase TauD [Actinomadura pelletieri DSM 43383]
MTRLLTGPNVWTAADLESGEPYVRHLTEPDLDALDNASDLTDLIADITDRLQNGMGYALLRGLPVGTRYTPEEAARLHRTLAERLGEIVPQNRTGDLSILLEDARHPAQPSGTYASKAGAPFHTDPTDIVSYLCLAPARSGGARVLASAATLYNSLAREHPEWLDLVSRDYATDREGQEPPGEPGWVSRPIFSTNGGGTLTCSLSPKRIMSAMRFEDVPRLDAEEMTCLMYLESLLRRPGTAVHVALEAGDMEFVNNHTVIHSRTGFVDDPSDPAHQRKLRRLWIDVS